MGASILHALDESRKFEIGQIGSHGTASSSAHLAGSLRPWLWRVTREMVRWFFAINPAEDRGKR
jgi:hypothetical protein